MSDQSKVIDMSPKKTKQPAKSDLVMKEEKSEGSQDDRLTAMESNIATLVNMIGDLQKSIPRPTTVFKEPSTAVDSAAGVSESSMVSREDLAGAEREFVTFRRGPRRAEDFSVINPMLDSKVSPAFYSSPPGDVTDNAAWKRRESLSGTSLPEPDKAPAIPVKEAVLVVDRNSFKDLSLRSLDDLSHVVYFLERYEAIKIQHPQHDWRIIHFLMPSLHPKVQFLAIHLKIMRWNSSTSEVMRLQDGDVLQCVYYSVRAKDTGDFVNKLKMVQFPKPVNGSALAPSASSFPSFLEATGIYTHKFLTRMELIGKCADDDAYPPMYKEGPILGIVNHYLNGFPAGSGNSLYARFLPQNKHLAKQTTMEHFANLFLELMHGMLKTYESYDMMDRVLKAPNLSTERKQSTGDNSDGNHSERVAIGPNRRFTGNRPYRVNALEELEENQPIWPDEEEQPDPAKFVNRVQLQEQHDDSVLTERVTDDVEVEPSDYATEDLNQLNDSKIGDKPKRPCYSKFETGKCTKPDCEYLHDRESMRKLFDLRMRSTVFGQHGYSEQEVRNLFDKILRDGPRPRPNATRA